MESLGGGPVVATQPPSPTPLAPPAAEPQAREQVCKREEASLEQLRADPKVDQVAEFARALACEDLRPQVQRLLESLGAPGQPSELAAAPASRGIAQIPEDAQACRRDAVENSRAFAQIRIARRPFASCASSNAKISIRKRRDCWKAWAIEGRNRARDPLDATIACVVERADA